MRYCPTWAVSFAFAGRLFCAAGDPENAWILGRFSDITSALQEWLSSCHGCILMDTSKNPGTTAVGPKRHNSDLDWPHACPPLWNWMFFMFWWRYAHRFVALPCLQSLIVLTDYRIHYWAAIQGGGWSSIWTMKCEKLSPPLYSIDTGVSTLLNRGVDDPDCCTMKIG